MNLQDHAQVALDNLISEFESMEAEIVELKIRIDELENENANLKEALEG